MDSFLMFAAALAAILWGGFVLLPWRPWLNREVVDATEAGDHERMLGDITVLIPARNEAAVIQQTLLAVIQQGPGIRVILIDDGSEDGTLEKAGEINGANVQTIRSLPLPAGWSGKLWALEQGRRLVSTRYTLLLDADIWLKRDTVKALKARMHQEGVSFISLMAVPSMLSNWEKLLMPAFVYFFKVLYPFGRVNSHPKKVAAAAGGCILLENSLLHEIGGFESIRAAVIDDCALARRVKSHGARIWLGLTHSAISARRSGSLKAIWDMVARTAFVQLHCSVTLLILCTVVIGLAFGLPTVMMASSHALLSYLALSSILIMMLTYVPMLRFYGRSWAWALCLPLIAGLFLAMTWTSAIRYWRGERTRWKGRIYPRMRPNVEVSQKTSCG